MSSRVGLEKSRVKASASLWAQVPTIWVGWVCARLILLYLLKSERGPFGDVAYYFFAQFGDDPSAMTEYPHAGTWPIEVLAWISGGDSREGFYVIFVIFCALLDALFLACLLRGQEYSDSRNARFYAAWFWVLFGTAAGHVFYLRLDLLPGLLVGLAALALIRFPNLGAFLIAFATTIKLWPGVLAAGLVGKFSETKTWTKLVTFAVSLLGLVGITVASAGLDRLLSPLQYQDKRGLQVESIAATLFVFRRLSDARYDVSYASSKSFEITGPGVSQAIFVLNIAMAAVLLFALTWAAWHFFAGGATYSRTVLFLVVIVLGLVVTNKVFSPQYIVWLGPIVAVAVRNVPQGKRRGGLILAALTVAAAALGAFIYPFYYDGIVGEPTHFAVILLVVRNTMIVGMFALASAWLGGHVREEIRQRGSTPETTKLDGGA